METPIFESGSGPAAADDADLIKESGTENFVADVIEASKTAPVIVDFWAPWCGPCKQLTPVLEKVVREAGGAVRLVKVNIDENQVLASQVGVQSIPAVFAFDQGRPVDGFMGALPESQVKEFIARIAPAGGAQQQAGAAELEAAQAALAAGELEPAAQIFAALLQQDPTNLEALAGLASCYAEIGEYERAEQALSMVPPEHAETEAVAAVRAKIELVKSAPDAAEVEALKARLAKADDDHQARYDLARALNAQGDRSGAVDELITIISRQADWQDEAARKLLLQFFEAWGANHPATVAGRQKLSSLLFA